jgi:hypothetical protein
MISVPDILGLAVCDYVIIEERTKKLSLIGNFSGFLPAAFRHWCNHSLINVSAKRVGTLIKI